jgi:hypothetical protein
MHHALIFLPLFLAGCTMFGPQYNSTYQFVAPKTKAARECAMRCPGRGAERAACHERCGGQVIEQRDCVSGCRHDHVAPVATPTMIVEE